MTFTEDETHPNSNDKLKRTSSELQLDCAQSNEQTPMNQSMLSLSKSLGAKVLSEDSVDSSNFEIFNSLNSMDFGDEFVDAKENQSYTSIDSKPATSKDSHDKMFILSGVGIEYDKMPITPKYIRFVDTQTDGLMI